MSNILQQLEPKALWQNFEALNAVPRASKKEERVRQFAVEFGKKLGLEVLEDAVGNVLIRKPANGLPDSPTVILQSHLDMVHQKNADCDFDFTSQGIRMYLDGDWVKAQGTTLGADNGIGVAACMAILQAQDIVHPPLEVLFTIDEETGMTGAKGLQAGFLTGKTLLNLDTEDDDELTIGCAGGLDVVGQGHYSQEEVSPDASHNWLIVKGLAGGHSGMDIHKGRANANKVMNRLLYLASRELPSLQIISIDGGGLRNAIPRESKALIAVAKSQREGLENLLNSHQSVLRAEFKSTDPGLTLELQPVDAITNKCLPAAFQKSLLDGLYSLPHGIYRLSPEVAGLVQTSNNLARVLVCDGHFSVQCLCRSAICSEKEDMARAISASLESFGSQVCWEGAYPGWAPLPNSDIVKLMGGLYREMFHQEPHVKACHAGLECGIIGSNYPQMEMISFGPNIRGAHSPDECVQISSVSKFWDFLLKTLSRL